MSVSQAHKVVFGRLYNSVWNERRLEFIDKIIAKTHALADPTVTGRGTGPSVYRRQVERFLDAFPDLKFVVEDTISEKDKLVVIWTATGTHRGTFMGIAPTNKKASVSGITVHQIADGKILESTAVWDAIGLLQELGVALPLQVDGAANTASAR
ncbi:MAG TPA: ester cyclase [Dongiaceae bacterium]|nr:ester cyclase [Dongiaceae bacterium]